MVTLAELLIWRMFQNLLTKPKELLFATYLWSWWIFVVVCLFVFITLNGIILNHFPGRERQSCTSLSSHPLMMLLHSFRVWWSLHEAGKISSLPWLWKCISPNLDTHPLVYAGEPEGSACLCLCTSWVFLRFWYILLVPRHSLVFWMTFG